MSMMMLGVVGDAKFHALLWELDVAVAQSVRGGRCPRSGCGGRLDVANYPRKVRGIGEAEAVAGRYELRLSLCCSVRGCRRRATPPSVRFLSRLVYAMHFIVAWAASLSALSKRADASQVEPGPSRQTTKRWQEYWGVRVTRDARMALLVGAPLVPSGTVAPNLVAALMMAAVGTEAERTLTTHRLLAPLTTATVAPERARSVMVG